MAGSRSTGLTPYLLVGVILVLVAAAAGVLITEELVVSQEAESGWVETPLLLVNGRTRLSLCVARLDGGAVGQPDVARFESALREVEDEIASLSYSQAVLTLVDQAAVVEGCPAAAAADPTKRFVDPKTEQPSVIGPISDTPSPHRLHIYLVSEQTLRDWFGDMVYGASAEEMFCGRPRTLSCAPVTQGLYLTSSITQELLRQALRGALGLYRPNEFPGVPTNVPTSDQIPSGEN